MAKIAKIETDWSFEEAPITEGPHRTTKWRQQGAASAAAEEETPDGARRPNWGNPYVIKTSDRRTTILEEPGKRRLGVYTHGFRPTVSIWLISFHI